MNEDQLTENEILTIQKFEKYVFENEVSNEFLVQIIERAGQFLSIKTIPDYSKENNISYNGVKKCREIKNIFGIKFVIDNK